MAAVQAEPEAASPTQAKNAGRGGMAIAVAKVSFVLFGFGQQLFLTGILGKEGYGVISRILAISGIVNNVIVALSIQGVSRTVSSTAPEDAPRTFRRVLAFHALLAMGIAVVFALVSGLVAEQVEAPEIAPQLRIMAVVIVLYGTYAALVGGLNGSRRFVDQAGLDIFYGGLRFATTVGGAYLAIKVFHGSGITGGVIGFASAAALIVPVALSRAGRGAAGGTEPSAKSYFAFLRPLAIGLVALNLLLQTDFLLFSRFLGEKAQEMGEPRERVDEIVGVYRAFQLFSFLPYQLLTSVTFVLFPMLARAVADKDPAAVARFTRTGVRLALILVGLFAGVVASIPHALLRFAFADPAIADLGAKAQSIHALGMAAFALLAVASTALTSLGKETRAAWLTSVGVALVAGASFLIVPRAEFGEPMMVASATATLAALTATMLAGAVVLRRQAGALVPFATPIRVGLAVAAVVVLGPHLPTLSRVLAPVEAAAIGMMYLLVLIVTGEIGRADLKLISSVVGRGGRK